MRPCFLDIADAVDFKEEGVSLDILSWEGFGSVRLWLSLAAVAIVMIPYIVLVITDFKYKEMEYWKILITCVINIAFFYIAYAILVDWEMAIIHSLAVWIAFIVLSYLNGLINKETVVGQADVDVFISQALLTGSFLLLIKDHIEPGPAYMFISLYFVQAVMTSILVGLVITLAAWIVTVVLHIAIRKEGFKKAFKENRSVPTLIAFLGWIFVNMYAVLGF